MTLLDDDTEDRDGDGFTDGQEAEAGTNPDSNTSIPGLGYSLVAWYPFDGNASDMSGNEHHGTINGATLGFDRHGEANKCYSFDGINDSIRATYTGSQYLFGEVSFGAWVKVKRIVADEAIIDLGGFYLNVLGSGRGNEGGTLEFGSGNWLYPQWASNFSNSASVDDQIWNQIFGIYDGDSLLVYKNGQLIKNRSSTTTNPTISFDLSIGKNKNGSRPTEGLIDEVRIYNRALLPREIFELYNLEKPNVAPSNLGSATPLTIGENQSIGTLVSNFNATDPDGDAITYHFVNGDNNNSLFTLDTNGTLKTATTFDYESNASSYTITVQAKDELNATTEGNFTVTLQDVFEDLDGDGTEDHLDNDMDGDGFTNAEEAAYGSDPRDGNSVANTPPTALTLDNLQILENQPIGSVVGKFTVVDPDPNDMHRVVFNNLNENGSRNHLFTIDTNNTLRTAVLFDFENNSTNMILRVKAKQGKVGVFWQYFTLSLINDPTDDAVPPTDNNQTTPPFNEHNNSSDNNNTQPPFVDHNESWDDNNTQYPSNDANETVADTLPTALTLDNLEILENQPIGTIVGKFTVVDPDPNDMHRVVFNNLNENGSRNHLFTIDSNNTLRTAVLFDFENNSTNMILRVKAKQGKVGVFWQYFTLSLINDPTDDLVPPTDNNQTTPPSNDHNNSSDHNTSQPTIPDGDGTVDGNHTLPTWDDHNNTQDDNGTLPPVTDPDSDQDTNPYAWIPIIHTDHPQILKDGRIQLSGRVLYDGGGTMSEFGFLLSPTLRIPLNSPDTLKLEANGTADSFTLIIPESPYPRRLYIQAYSTNEAGMGLGQRRRLKIPEPPAKWWGKAMHGEGGWLESPWFGAFKYYEQGWLFHAELGWLYSSPAEDGVWLWGSDNQWLWTKDGLYPYHYRWDDAAWGIWQKTANGSIRTYNYGTGRYE